MRRLSKTERDRDRSEAKRLGLAKEHTRRRELEKALGKAYGAHAITFLDACIAQNEIDVAYEAIVVSRPRPKPKRRGCNRR
jgi:hypothetical protein